MEKKLYWLVESTGDLSVTAHDISQVKDIIETDFEDGDYDIGDLQYTITPKYLSKTQYKNLGEW